MQFPGRGASQILSWKRKCSDFLKQSCFGLLILLLFQLKLWMFLNKGDFLLALRMLLGRSLRRHLKMVAILITFKNGNKSSKGAEKSQTLAGCPSRRQRPVPRKAQGGLAGSWSCGGRGQALKKGLGRSCLELNTMDLWFHGDIFDTILEVIFETILTHSWHTEQNVKLLQDQTTSWGNCWRKPNRTVFGSYLFFHKKSAKRIWLATQVWLVLMPRGNSICRCKVPSPSCDKSSPTRPGEAGVFAMRKMRKMVPKGPKAS